MPLQAMPFWKFWYPMPLWQALVIAFVVELLCIGVVVALREGLGLGVPAFIGPGVGGAAAFFAVNGRANQLTEKLIQGG